MREKRLVRLAHDSGSKDIVTLSVMTLDQYPSLMA
jgi:hypothetical protein